MSGKIIGGREFSDHYARANVKPEEKSGDQGEETRYHREEHGQPYQGGGLTHPEARRLCPVLEQSSL